MTLEPTKTSKNYVMCHELQINTGQSYITIYFQGICFGHKTIYKLNIVNNELKLDFMVGKTFSGWKNINLEHIKDVAVEK